MYITIMAPPNSSLTFQVNINLYSYPGCQYNTDCSPCRLLTLPFHHVLYLHRESGMREVTYHLISHSLPQNILSAPLTIESPITTACLDVVLPCWASRGAAATILQGQSPSSIHCSIPVPEGHFHKGPLHCLTLLAFIHSGWICGVITSHTFCLVHAPWWVELFH